MWGDLPGWVQAIGSAGAIIVAVVLWRFDRQREVISQEKMDRERTRRLVAGLRAEIRYALESTERHWSAMKLVLAQTKQAMAAGKTIRDGSFPNQLFALTDAVIFRELASELGQLPPILIENIVSFYSFARDIERLAGTEESTLRSFKLVEGLIPRLRFSGELTLAMLEQFELRNFNADADVNVGTDKLQQIAKRVEHPLDGNSKVKGL